MDLQLDEKVARASKGIGRDVTEHLAAEGATVAITARTAAPLAVTAKEIQAVTGQRVLALAADMSVTTDVTRCVDATGDHLGPIDILVTCAGSSPGGLPEDLTEEQWMSSLNLMFMGYVRSVRAVIGQTREPGKKAFAGDKGVTQDRAHELAQESIPVGRICEPDAVTVLASPRASFVSGARIPVDGAPAQSDHGPVGRRPCS